MRLRNIVFGALGVAALTAGSALPASAGGGAGHVVKVRAFDTCDPVTFNAVLGDGACTPVKRERHPTTFAQLVASADPVNHTASAEWRFKPAMIEADAGDVIRVTNLGGEVHSFTEVPTFGGGCVPETNALVGFAPTASVVPNCGAAFATLVPPGGTSSDIAVGSPGVHRFICIIHPWMRATVDVEADDD